MPLTSYEEAVSALRAKPELSQFIEDCYLDDDTIKAAERFSKSSEFESVCKTISRYIKIKGSSILDLGCGSGIAAYSFAKMGANVVGADIDLSSTVGLGAAKRLSDTLGNRKFTVVRSAAEMLPFMPRSFDVVYVRQALHHFRSLEEGLRQCALVLKPRGILIACREHVVDDQAQLNEFLANHPLHNLHGGENAYPERNYRTAIKLAGFKLLRVFRPYDTVINHFPIHDSEVRNWLMEALQRRVGSQLATVILKVELLETAYRMKLSRACKYPGRLFSFLAVKGSRN